MGTVGTPRIQALAFASFNPGAHISLCHKIRLSINPFIQDGSLYRSWSGLIFDFSFMLFFTKLTSGLPLLLSRGYM